ncbi:hypothetical protein PG993_006302 [Apiospora rasikravindrae]|uniref:Uncharacterized protein n=1 Tax=Apiospora rasikravindrae TaxID=990691 RepID=A0ABR1T7F4_9PEZI
MADLFQLLNVAYDADFVDIRQAYYRRLQYIRRYVKEEERAQETDSAVKAWRVLGSSGTRAKYLEQLRRDSLLGAGQQQQDAQFQRGAARREGSQAPTVSPVASTASASPAKSVSSNLSDPKDEVEAEKNELKERLPAQWFKPVATSALTTIGFLKEDLTEAYETTDRTRRQLVLELRHTPELVQTLGVYFRLITEAFDLVAVKMAELEDYARPATVEAVRDDWDHRSIIMTRLAAARDVSFKFCDNALLLQEVVGEMSGEDGSDKAREDELLRDLRVILDQWLQLINTFHPGHK